ncbi:peptidase domain-containing ABC transporter [Rhodobacter maris]|uniref:ATP-binding cassette subfamily B protein n=1 Tax=Rhodobacter maris TaxID=446682 RepID=A0A285SSW8_9RHOB|nr:peptidase domain-containing ABC transporter [Rhodobacter maris]SOC11604.1 ATP-binding cassette subfamily B protein [Rhodobacter maris]
MTTLRALFLLCLHHGVTLPVQEFPALREGDFAPMIEATLRRTGFRVRSLRGAGWRLASRLGGAYPALCEGRDGGWFILVHVVDLPGGAQAAILDPAQEAKGIQLLPQAEFEARWSGKILLAQLKKTATTARRPFGLAWFLPALWRQRGALAGVATAVIVGNLISYCLPFLTQVMIDKVIGHHTWNTLFSIVGVYVFLAVFDASFTYVRSRLMLIAGGRIDAGIGAAVHAHLLSLPLSVFETTPSGVLARNMQLTEKVRHFLSGRLFQTLLDAALLPLLLTLMALLSGMMTLTVLGFALTIAGLLAAFLPALQRRLSALYDAEANRQAHLVETLHNMRTVKALVLEGTRRSLWENALSRSIRSQWAVGELSASVGALTGLMEKLMQVTLLGLGTGLVLQGEISVGTLVAFMMLSGRVTGPLVQIVGLINEWQEAALAVRTIRGMMDHPPERGPEVRPIKPQLTGAIRIEDLRFCYPGSSAPALDGLSLEIAAGQVIGVVGRSGSGKTTLTRLLQGIGSPQSGRILYNGEDIRHIDLDHLRRSVGIVLQENVLFRGSLRENISMARPDAGHEAVLRAAELAGATEFIDRLPRGLDTVVEEGGANLSGGQRQRIALARALLADPPILILDEATSALDPESEALVNRNIAAIAQGRTVIVVSHRISSLSRSDAILVLDRGRIEDFAPHAVLLQRSETYRHLWQQQAGHSA